MTLPRRMIGIMGVIHVLLVTYSILVVLVFLAVEPHSPPLSACAAAFRTYGWLLYLLPLAWTVLTAWFLAKPEPPRATIPMAVWTWSALTLLLLACDVILSVEAAHVHSVLPDL